jgi:hypothetical protein
MHSIYRDAKSEGGFLMPLSIRPISQRLVGAYLVATRTGALIAVIGSGLGLGLPAPAYADEETEEAGRIAKVRVFSQLRESVQDAALAEVRGRGGPRADGRERPAGSDPLGREEVLRDAEHLPPTGAAYDSAGAITVTYRGGVQ